MRKLFGRANRADGLRRATLGARRANARSTRGVTAIEFAMVAPLFFLLIFAVIDFGELFFLQMEVEEAVQEGGRYGSTGATETGKTRLQSIEDKIQQNAPGLTIPTSSIQVTSYHNGVATSNSSGGPNDTVNITVTLSLKVLPQLLGQYFPAGNYTFTSSTTFQNEPFPPS